MGRTRNDIRDMMQHQEVKITSFEVTHSKLEFTKDCIDLTNRLLVRDPKDRIGYNDGIREIKKHSWFYGFDWDKLEKKLLPAPFKPVVSADDTDQS